MLFKYGVAFNFLSAAINRFSNGAFRFELTGPGIVSSGTGHWPFYLFHFVAATGHLAAWQLSVMGLTFGMTKVRNLDEDGNVAGPDKNKHYFFLSALNHKDKLLEEII